MSARRLLCSLVHREFRALLVHRVLAAALLVSLALGVLLSLSLGSSENRLWVAYQGIYYVAPLFAILASIMIVRQDLREGPLLALLPGSSVARVCTKFMVSGGYLCLLLALLLVPSMLRPGTDCAPWLSLGWGGMLVALVFVALGVWLGFRTRHEVRAYLGGMAGWFALLFGSGAVAYGGHLLLSARYTPGLTLMALMGNPLESFRLFVFFRINAIPMNPQTDNAIALWWIGHPLTWLTLITLPFLILPLVHAGWNLRLRAHHAD